MIYKGENIFKFFDTLMRETLKEVWETYWELHRDFYNTRLEYYNHPTGVPMNWDGTRYDVPNLGFRKTVLGLVLTLYGSTSTTLGTAIIIGVKFIPVQLMIIKKYLWTFPEMLCCSKIVLLPFWLAVFPVWIGLLGPVAAVLCVLAAPMVGLVTPYVALKDDLNLREAFRFPFVLLALLDEQTYHLGWNFRMLPDIEAHTRPSSQSQADNVKKRQKKYWRLYLKNCQQAASECLEKNWIQKDDLECMSSDVLQSIPAASILNILLKSVAEEPKGFSIHWEEGDRCDSETCRGDDLASFFWPKLMNIRAQLENVTKDEQCYLSAKLCSNSSNVPKEITTILETTTLAPARRTQLHRLCADINDVVLVLLRMKQMQELLPKLLEGDIQDSEEESKGREELGEESGEDGDGGTGNAEEEAENEDGEAEDEDGGKENEDDEEGEDEVD